jgi:hypothetical protein
MPHVPDHQTDHDPLLVAAYAAGDAEGDGLDRARELVATCTECAVLHHDLRAIAAAMPATPAPARTRDFRLSPEQAAQLRPAGWRRLLAPLAGPRFAFAAPLGGSLAALGIAGILVAGLASTPIAGTGGAYEATSAGTAGGDEPTMEIQVGAASAAPVEAPGAVALQPQASAAASDAGYTNQGAPASSAPVAIAVPDAAASADPDHRSSTTDTKAATAPGSTEAPPVDLHAGPATTPAEASLSSPMTSALLVLAFGVLVAGVILVVGRLAARRVA